MGTKTFEFFEDGISVWKRTISIPDNQQTHIVNEVKEEVVEKKEEVVKKEEVILTGATKLVWGSQLPVGVQPGSDGLFVATVPEGTWQMMKIDLFGTSEEMVADTEWTHPDGHTRKWSIRGSNVADKVQLWAPNIPAGNYYIRLKGVVGGGLIIRAILV